MRNFTGKKLFLTVMSASYTLRGFAQDARGAINDVLDSFTLPVFGGFMLGGIILGLIWKSHSTLTLLATQNYPFWLKYD